MTRPVYCGTFLLISFWLLPFAARAQPVFAPDKSLDNAFTGICIYDPAEKKYLVESNADKYFVPASNQKILTLYAGYRYLKDSLPGIFVKEFNDHIEIEGTGDPTLLHPAFKSQSVFDFLKNCNKRICLSDKDIFKTEALGPGWAWEDYRETYMPEKSELPVMGNLAHIRKRGDFLNIVPIKAGEVALTYDTTQKSIYRDPHQNLFYYSAVCNDSDYEIPFITSPGLSAKILEDTLKKEIICISNPSKNQTPLRSFYVRSMPVDSLLIPMMYNSDNFFAEQLLLMASYMAKGTLDEKEIIEELLDNDLADLPTKPLWVDGSGLSRYNLITPRDLVLVLEKLEKGMGRSRVFSVFPSGGKGTLKGYYESELPYLFAKTGSMGHINALSGYVLTKSGKLLIFSILVNNHSLKSTSVRRLIEKYLINLRATL